MGCLYKLTSPSGKSYIGITSKTLEERWIGHLNRVRVPGAPGVLYNAIRKYGPDSFRKEVVAECDDWSLLQKMEVDAIVAHGTRYPAGYNLTDGGEGIIGAKPPWFRERVAAAQKRRYADPTQREILRRNGLKGTVVSAAKTRKPPKPHRTKEQKSAAIRTALSDPAMRAFLSSCSKGRRMSHEAKAKISAANKGSKKGPASEERKAKIKAAQLKSWNDPERRAKRLAGMAAARAAKVTRVAEPSP